MGFNLHEDPLELTLGRSYFVPEKIQQPVEAASSSSSSSVQPIQRHVDAPSSTQPIQRQVEAPSAIQLIQQLQAPSAIQLIQQLEAQSAIQLIQQLEAPSSTQPILQQAEAPIQQQAEAPSAIQLIQQLEAPPSTQPIQQQTEAPSAIQLIQQLEAPSSTQPIQQQAEAPSSEAPSAIQLIQQLEIPSSLAPSSLAPSSEAPSSLALSSEAPSSEAPSSEAPSSEAAMIEPRRKKGRRSANNKDPIVPPYPWATDKRCKVYSLQFLKNHGYVSITGNVKCRKCERSYEMSLDLESASRDVLKQFTEELHNRAPNILMNPILPDCLYCHQKNAVRPEIGDKKKNINWLFLFLGQMLGCCTGEQLKYFCKHDISHRTAAKNRLLFLVYTGICKQLFSNDDDVDD